MLFLYFYDQNKKNVSNPLKDLKFNNFFFFRIFIVKDPFHLLDYARRKFLQLEKKKKFSTRDKITWDNSIYQKQKHGKKI